MFQMICFLSKHFERERKCLITDCTLDHVRMALSATSSFSVQRVGQINSNQMKQFILLHDFYKFWYTLTKIKWLNISNRKSCVGR